MTPLIDEHVQAVGEEVRELANLHAQLALTEIREGTTSFVRGVILCAFGVLASALVLVAFGMVVFFLANRTLTPAGAATVVMAAYGVIGWATIRFGTRSLERVSSLFLPRTRAMLWELVTCRDKRTKS
jgi:uncharacterized membrane protein YqjE